MVSDMQVMKFGRMALARDTTGVEHAFWQVGNFAGFGVMDEPGSIGWFDHVSGNIQKSADYYLAVLGNDIELQRDGAMAILRHGDQWFASLSLTEPGQDNPQWTPVFVVDSLDTSKSKVRELGGKIIIEEMEVPGSKISIFCEPVTGQYITIMAAGPAA